MNQADDPNWMDLALELAARGEGHVEPNPMVGCVLVRDGREIGRGFHQQFGQPHAEVAALASCQQDPAGATAYVNLEPCNHHGKTPPCVDALIDAQIGRVVVAAEDPFPEVSGRGIERLQQAGVIVETGVREAQAWTLNAPYFKRIRTGLPWIIAKWAMTLDGKIATRTGDSRWISSEASRAIVHQLRGRVDAIVVGSRTALADDPLLTARPAGPRVATRVVIDSRLRLPTDSQLVATADQYPTLIATCPDADPAAKQVLVESGCEILDLAGAGSAQRLGHLFDELGRRQMTNILVEGGGALLGSLFDQGMVDEVHAFVSNCVVGGHEAINPVGGTGIPVMADALRLHAVTRQIVDEDVYVFGRLRGPETIAGREG